MCFDIIPGARDTGYRGPVPLNMSRVSPHDLPDRLLDS